ncbi:MAG: DUF1194 domain-containing protein [Alphaproteobacteria bacterium]|nr:MAG: DUF1194 domain-containing protein [Alphaproteobacteria bacterium]
MFIRRTLLTGGLALLATPSIIRPLQAKTRTPVLARVVTGFDATGSTTAGTVHVRRPNLTAFAQVMAQDMPDIISQSDYDVLDFEVFGWADESTHTMVARTMLQRDSCTDACLHIADKLAQLAEEIVKGDTELTLPLKQGIAMAGMASAASKRVFNLVTDDDTSRTRPQTDLQALRDIAIARRITVNGLIMGDPSAMNNYVDRDIRTPDGFVLRTTDYTSNYAAWRQKFIWDIG